MKMKMEWPVDFTIVDALVTSRKTAVQQTMEALQRKMKIFERREHPTLNRAMTSTMPNTWSATFRLHEGTLMCMSIILSTTDIFPEHHPPLHMCGASCIS